jgi:aminopeptidase N
MTKKTIERTVAATVLLFFVAAIPVSAQRRPPVDTSDRPKIDVESYIIDVTIMPAEHQVSATVDVKFRQLERQNFATFDLDSRLHVDKVTIDGTETRPRQYDLDSTVEVSTANAQGTTITAHFEYKGFFDPAADKRAPVTGSVSEDGAFLLYESKWFPTNEVFKDKATITMKVHAPADWTVLSDIPGSGGSFSSQTPSYWGLLAAGKYTTSTVKIDRGELSVHTLKAKAEDSKALVDHAGKALNFYTETFGAPPQQNFRIIEAAGANWPSRWGVGAMLLSSTQFRPDFDAQALSRALAHQWFPLKFAVGDSARDSWLSDGLATFASLQFAEKDLPPAGYQEQIDKALVKALSSESAISTAEAGKLDRESPDYHALVEYKGAYIFRMLRWVIGENKFHDFLVKYVERFEKTPATTDAVKKLAADVSGQDLDYFFEQWLSDSGVPEMTAEWQILRVKDGYRVIGVIKQDLDLFRMPVELEVTTDGEPDYKRVDVARQSSDFVVETGRKPKDIAIDPRKWILRVSPDIKVAVSINRGEEFMNEGRLNDAMDEFQDALDMDAQSSLAAFKMGEAMFEQANVTAAAKNFRDALNGDLKPKWIEVWSYINLGKIYDFRGDHDRAIPEYEKAIGTGDDAFGAQAYAQRYKQTPFRRGDPTQ